MFLLTCIVTIILSHIGTKLWLDYNMKTPKESGGQVTYTINKR